MLNTVHARCVPAPISSCVPGMAWRQRQATSGRLHGSAASVQLTVLASSWQRNTFSERALLRTAEKLAGGRRHAELCSSFGTWTSLTSVHAVREPAKLLAPWFAMRAVALGAGAEHGKVAPPPSDIRRAGVQTNQVILISTRPFVSHDRV